MGDPRCHQDDLVALLEQLDAPCAAPIDDGLHRLMAGIAALRRGSEGRG